MKKQKTFSHFQKGFFLSIPITVAMFVYGLFDINYNLNEISNLLAKSLFTGLLTGLIMGLLNMIFKLKTYTPKK